MSYAEMVEDQVRIGGGVTEAACEVAVRRRPSGWGMKPKGRGAAAVRSPRCLRYTPGRWGEFWGRVARWGFPVAA